MKDTSLQNAADNRERHEPPSSNHVIWGMTAGLLLGTVLGFFVFDNVAIGIAIGIGIGAGLSIAFLVGRS